MTATAGEAGPVHVKQTALRTLAITGLLACLTAGSAIATAAFDHQHPQWTQLLTRYVQDGVVDYASLANGGQEQLQAYLDSLESVSPQEFARWDRNEKLAFWVNAYNAYTVRLILDHYPIDSIRSIGLFPNSAFRRDFIPLGHLSGQDEEISLDEVEHGILRPEFKEPRIHFALVCAAKGCPKLRAEAYRAQELDRQLDEAAREFLRNPEQNRYDASTNTLYLSSVFDWFAEDFQQAAGSVPAFVARYLEEDAAENVRARQPRIEFLDYDWDLNER